MAQPPNSSGQDNRPPRRRDPRGVVRARLLPTAQAFIHTEAAGGIVLLAAVAVALVWANSPINESYFDLWHHEFRLGIGDFSIETDLHHVVNDGLMTIFFYVVGLEIKRELVEGELRQPRQALLPVAGAVGGMAVPALLYTAFNAGGDGADGWGIPVATDIAMAVGVMALLGPRVPVGIKVFLLALAIVDDLGGILIIAIFYSQGLSLIALGAAVVIVGALVLLRVLQVSSRPLYGLLALGLFVAVLESGIHATIAGVILAFLTSAGSHNQVGESLLDRLEETLHPWASFVVVPIFALANGGIEVTRDALDGALTGEIAPGIAAGLVIGKPLGIVAGAFVVVALGLASLPVNSNWRQVLGAGLLAGIGFTVSIFISGLAFDDAALNDEAKIGILAASVVAGAGGFLWLRFCCPVIVPAQTAGEMALPEPNPVDRTPTH